MYKHELNWTIHGACLVFQPSLLRCCCSLIRRQSGTPSQAASAADLNDHVPVHGRIKHKIGYNSVYIDKCQIFTGRQRSCKPCISYRRQAVCPSVRPSVRLSDTPWHCVKTARARITKSSPTDSPRILVFGIKNSFRNSKGFIPSEGVKWEWGRENSQFSANNSPYLRNGARWDQSYY